MLASIHFSDILVYSNEQPNERCKKMGYFQNLEIELQEIHDPELRAIVEWDYAHRHLLTPDERWRILTDEALLQREIAKFNSGNPRAPKPAADHVALQPTRRVRHRQPKRSRAWVFGWSLITVALVAGVIVVVVNL
jgi:hypothetical protein